MNLTNLGFFGKKKKSSVGDIGFTRKTLLMIYDMCQNLKYSYAESFVINGGTILTILINK